MQNGGTKSKTAVEAGSVKPRGHAKRGLHRRQFRLPNKLPASDQFRQNHGNGLQCLSLFYGIPPLCFVLHDQNAEDTSPPQDRYAKQ